MEYEHATQDAQFEGKSLVYPNQEAAAKRCIELFTAGTLFVLLVAQPGTGKTGTILETLKLLSTDEDNEKCMETRNIHIISGMDDTDWKCQMEEKMLPSFKKNIYHRSALAKQVDKLASINNGIVVTDECHYASGKNMTVSNILCSAGLNNCAVLETRKIRLLDISATCEAVGWDLKGWGDKAAVVPLPPGESYKGFEVMLNEGRIIQAPLFDDYESVLEWFNFFNNRYLCSSKKFFPIRINPKKHIWFGHIRRAALEFNWDIINHDSESRIEDIDEMMSHAPVKHTVILIKGFWRASKRLVRRHVGGSYEDVPKAQNDTSAAQGLIGRFCDNYEYEGDELDINLRPVHFGDKKSIIAYVNWFKNGCNFKEENYSCARIKSRNGCISAKATKIHPSNMLNLDAVEVHNHPLSEVTLANKDNLWLDGFYVEGGNDDEVWAQVRTRYMEILGKDLTGKAMPKKIDGFYNCSTTGHVDKQSKSNIEKCFSQSWWSTFQLTQNKLSYARVFVGYDDLEDLTKYTIYIKYAQIINNGNNLAIINRYSKKPRRPAALIVEESDEENEVIGSINI